MKRLSLLFVLFFIISNLFTQMNNVTLEETSVTLDPGEFTFADLTAPNSVLH